MNKYFEPERKLSIHDSIGEYFDQKEATGCLSPKTIENRKYELLRFAGYCIENNVKNVAEIHKNLVISYLKEQKVQAASKLGIIYVLTSYMDFLVNEGLILENIVATIGKPKVYPPKTDYLTWDELETVFSKEAENASKKLVDRNLLLFTLFTDICLRVSEVIHMKINDVRLDSRELWIVRKRNKVEKIPVNEYMRDKFLNWLAVRSTFKGSDSSWVFLSTHGKQLTSRQVHNIVSKALARAGIIKRKQGPHLLRHSGASLKAQAGENLVMIQYLLGHENLNTTRRYLHFDWQSLQQLVDRSPRFDKPG